jgi:uncharacterized protein (DUF433 family)
VSTSTRGYGRSARAAEEGVALSEEVAIGLEVVSARPVDLREGSCLTRTARPMMRAMDYQGRIVIDPEIRFGKPCVRGTRITVGDVLSYLASGMREDQILADFPQLAREDIRACLAFAAERERRIVSSPAA